MAQESFETETEARLFALETMMELACTRFLLQAQDPKANAAQFQSDCLGLIRGVDLDNLGPSGLRARILFEEMLDQISDRVRESVDNPPL